MTSKRCIDEKIFLANRKYFINIVHVYKQFFMKKSYIFYS